MKYEIEAGGRLRHVTVSRAGDGFAVTVDGRTRQVDAARIDAHTLSLIVDRGVSAGPQDPRDTNRAGLWTGRRLTTTIAPEAGGRLVVLVGAVPITVRLNGVAEAAGACGAAAGSIR